MLKKEFTFEGSDGVERTEEHYFHLNEAEISKWLTTDGDYTLDDKLRQIANERNGKKIVEVFEELIRLSYGKPSLDGRKFMKNDEIWEDFHDTEAYSILFMELVTDADKAAQFVNGIIPKKLRDKIEAVEKANTKAIESRAESADFIPNGIPTPIPGA